MWQTLSKKEESSWVNQASSLLSRDQSDLRSNRLQGAEYGEPLLLLGGNCLFHSVHIYDHSMSLLGRSRELQKSEVEIWGVEPENQHSSASIISFYYVTFGGLMQ